MKNHHEWMGKDEEGNKNGIDLSIRETMKIICSFSIGIKYEWKATEAEERRERKIVIISLSLTSPGFFILFLKKIQSAFAIVR